MYSVAIGPGDDVEAWCTRCRMNLNHRVIAVVGSEIKRVQCLTCGGDHKYYPPKYDRPASKGPKAVRVSGSTRSTTSKEKAAARASSEWKTIMKDMPTDSTPRLYRISESYERSEFIEHPTFGIGKVTDVLGSQRVQVIFEAGRKVLVCNKS